MSIWHMKKSGAYRIIPAVVLLGGITGAALGFSINRASAACSLPSSNYGSLSYKISVPKSGKYRLWSRMMTADTAHNSFMIEVDGKNCFMVGGRSIAANTWTWADYQNANSSSKITPNLAAGNHTVKIVGHQPGVKVDRVLALTDTTCLPTGFGDNCAISSGGNSKLAVILSEPSNGSTVNGAVDIDTNVASTQAVTRIDFLINGTLEVTDNSAPYGFNWATQNLPDGKYTITAKAYDAAGHESTSMNTVTVKNAGQ